MAHVNQRDIELVNFILEKTEKGEMTWEPTAAEDQFTTSFKGKYNITVDLSHPEGHEDDYWFRLTDASGQELLLLYDTDTSSVRSLFHAARRRSLNVDAAIDEIMGTAIPEITDEDIPL